MMNNPTHILVALYDAHAPDAHLVSDEHMAKARTLGHTLGSLGFGGIGEASSPVVSSILSALSEAGAFGLSLSPAASRSEHEIAYRLPHSAVPTLFTGRGAYGADVMALSSAHAIIIAGSEHDALEAILRSPDTAFLPIGVLSEEDSEMIHARIRSAFPEKTPVLFVSSDPRAVATYLSGEIRRKKWSE